MAAPSAPPLVEDWGKYSRVVRDSLGVTRPMELFAWLQGELQYFLPHEVLIAAWGDFAAGEVRYDIVSVPRVSSDATVARDMSAFLRRVHERWVEFRRLPFGMSQGETPGVAARIGEGTVPLALRTMHSILVHGLHDERSNQDCLYIAMNSDLSVPPNSRKMLEILLPYIDTALRRVSPLPQHYARADEKPPVEAPESVAASVLSARELEILDWVRNGKTNLEIGMILNISAFTVKNHLQRIFRKLDVCNRVQAVGKLSVVPTPPNRQLNG
jgi:transcriptional regulator EpsA